MELQNVLVVFPFLLVFINPPSHRRGLDPKHYPNAYTYPSQVDSSLPIVWTDEPLLYLGLR